MAIEKRDNKKSARGTIERRLLMGTNVAVSIALLVGLVTVIQVLAFSFPIRWDMTSTGVNSLGEGTENMLAALEMNVRITSLYFETDRETEEQSGYRQSVADLIALYEATNRTRVSTRWINPLKDHDKYKALITDLRKKDKFQKELAECRDRLEAFTNADGLYDDLTRLLEAERELAAPIAASPVSPADRFVAQIEDACGQLIDDLRVRHDRIEDLASTADFRTETGINEVSQVYRTVKNTLDAVIKEGAAAAAADASITPSTKAFLEEAADRYADALAQIEAEQTSIQEMGASEFDDFLSQIGPTSNAIVVETDNDAMVVDHFSVWRSADPRSPVKNFNGEQKLTAAILRATHTEQTAVVFVRYGGAPLFFGMPGQPPAQYSRMKQQLEDANFVVVEWHLKTTTTRPEIDPEPTKTIYVVLAPTPTDPMAQMRQQLPEPPFTGKHRTAVLKAVKESGRAMFLAGWMSITPMALLSAPYEFADHLSKEWGIEVDSDRLLLRSVSVSPGKYRPAGGTLPAWTAAMDVEVSDHDIMYGAQARQVFLPWCTPLTISADAPEGVEVETLITQPRKDGVWAVKDPIKYLESVRRDGYVTRLEDATDGPFDLALAASKGDDKIVVVSSREFATDAIAFRSQLVVQGGGLAIRSVSPGNITLLINSLHWLNDNSEFMNLGKPLEPAVLSIEDPATETTVAWLTIGVWPGLASLCGVAVWWVRRR
ncbi:MAG: Gldg family protein [Planctomycetes bacterium]|nr:Gldg family protein [Planctomycetota bacterium]